MQMLGNVEVLCRDSWACLVQTQYFTSIFNPQLVESVVVKPWRTGGPTTSSNSFSWNSQLSVLCNFLFQLYCLVNQILDSPTWQALPHLLIPLCSHSIPCLFKVLGPTESLPFLESLPYPTPSSCQLNVPLLCCVPVIFWCHSDTDPTVFPNIMYFYNTMQFTNNFHIHGFYLSGKLLFPFCFENSNDFSILIELNIGRARIQPQHF